LEDDFSRFYTFVYDRAREKCDLELDGLKNIKECVSKIIENFETYLH